MDRRFQTVRSLLLIQQDPLCQGLSAAWNHSGFSIKTCSGWIYLLDRPEEHMTFLEAVTLLGFVRLAGLHS